LTILGGARIGRQVRPERFNAGGTTPARVTALQRVNGSKTGTILAGREYEFDPIGRLSKEKQLLSGQSWPSGLPCTTQCNQRVTSYDTMDRKASVSEWQGYNPATAYRTDYVFDLFGRPTTITPPDGTAHNITFAYNGVRQVDRTVKIATAPGAESPVTSSEEYDRQGRLWKVKEYSDPANPTTYVTTTYTFTPSTSATASIPLPPPRDRPPRPAPSSTTTAASCSPSNCPKWAPRGTVPLRTPTTTRAVTPAGSKTAPTTSPTATTGPSDSGACCIDRYHVQHYWQNRNTAPAVANQQNTVGNDGRGTHRQSTACRRAPNRGGRGRR